jgi:hypothetical protein
MEAAVFSERLVPTYHTTQCVILEHINLQLLLEFVLDICSSTKFTQI